MARSHLFHLGSTVPQVVRPGGTRIDAKRQNFPILSGMSLSLLKLHPDGIREPHWHPNANELGYCLEGKGLMTIFGPNASHHTFEIEPGTLAFVPMGYMHHIQNIGDQVFKMIICFDHEEPQDLHLSSSIFGMSDSVLGKTFQLKPSFFAGLKEDRDTNPIFISQQEARPASNLAWMTDHFKFNIEHVNPQVQSKGGWAKMSNGSLFPALEGLAVFSLLLTKEGVREPHWHPNAHELNYLISGMTRITLLSPNGEVDTFEMKPGDISFLPRGFLHHIENTGKEPAHLAVFFNHSHPSDIGISGCLGAYSNQVLASLFHVSASYFDQLPKYQEDLLVVGGG